MYKSLDCLTNIKIDSVEECNIHDIADKIRCSLGVSCVLFYFIKPEANKKKDPLSFKSSSR